MPFTSPSGKPFEPTYVLAQDGSLDVYKIDYYSIGRFSISGSNIGITFSVGDIIRLDPDTNTYELAQANSEENAEVLGIVAAVIDNNNIVIHEQGYLNFLSGLTPGCIYFLSESTPGSYTVTEPSNSGEVSKPLFLAISSTEAIFKNYRGMLLGGVAGGDGSSIKSITVENPTTSEDITFFFSVNAFTFDQITAVIIGSSSPAVTWTLRFNSDRTAAGTEVITGGTNTNNSTTGEQITTFNNPNVPANSYIWLETTASSGTVNELNLTINITES